MLKFIKTCVSVLLAAASAVPGTLAVYAAGDGGSDMPENTAYYDFSSSGGQHLVTAAMGDGSSPNIVTRGGREGW